MQDTFKTYMLLKLINRVDEPLDLHTSILYSLWFGCMYVANQLDVLMV